MLAVTDGTGNVLETYTHGADLSGQVGGGAGGIGGILASTQAGGAAHYHYDFNGNIVNVSSSNQTQLAKYTYGPFGEVLLKEGSFDSRYQFSTKELDGSTGMNYYGYRFYSPEMGRWLSRDPLGEIQFRSASSGDGLQKIHASGLDDLAQKLSSYEAQQRAQLREGSSLNLYGFVGSDPVSIYDYLGLAKYTWPLRPLPGDWGEGKLCTDPDCEPDNCPIQALPPSGWHGDPDPWNDVPAPGDCGQTDGVATPSGILKIPDNCTCTLNCDGDGNPENIECDCHPWGPDPELNPPGFPPNPYIPQPNSPGGGG